MKISYLRISNILGIDNFEVAPGGTLTEISGDNGLGKTSILDAIKAATQGGHDATLLRQGAEKGEIVLVLDDGTELHKHVAADKSSLNLFKDGKKIGKPSDTIKGLTDLLSVNPVDFLVAPKKDRVKVLLEAMPIEVDIKKLEEITGIPVTAQEGVPGLVLINTVRTEIYDDRTGTNRAVKEKEGTINQLTLAMPEVPGGVEGDEGALQAQLDAARTKRDAETKRIDDKLITVRSDSAARTQALKSAARDAVDAENKALQEAIDAMRAVTQKKINDTTSEAQAAVEQEIATLADTEAKAARVRQKALDTFTDLAAPINTTLEAIRGNRNAFAKREQTKQTISQMETELEDLVKDSERQTAAIEALDQYKSDLLASLPIPGLEVMDGDVFRGGIQFDRLNTAQQVDIAIEIAKLRAGDLAICCVDRFEALSPATFEEFKKRAELSNLQLFVTRVEPGELTVRTS